MDLEEGIFSMNSPKNEPSFSVDIEVLKDDITKREVDVVVNAAHEHLSGGGGVDGAIHEAAGQKLLGECLQLYGCPEGKVRMTNGYDLPAKYIIHTVGPVWTPGEEKQEIAKKILSDCYKNSLDMAETQGLKSIAFPCISTGAYCFPKELAAEIAIHTIYEWFHHLFLSQRPDAKVGCYLDVVEIVCFTDKDVDIYRQAIKNEEESRILPKCTNLEKAGICSYISPSDNGCRFGKKCWMDSEEKKTYIKCHMEHTFEDTICNYYVDGECKPNLSKGGFGYECWLSRKKKDGCEDHLTCVDCQDTNCEGRKTSKDEI